MTSGSGALNEKALALFELALGQERGTRTAWIKERAGDDAALRDKALSYLSHDKMTQGAFHTGGAFHETLDDTALPDRIGAYKITGLIGRGGMGAVYRGERASGDFDHDVAIKVVRPGAMSDKLVARFEAERQTLASLSHPNIARLFDGGTLDSGAPYIVMEFIDGLPITEFADKNNAAKVERLALFKAVCSAVSHAHQNLIIHRDITPSNVLVDTEGQVKLIDFGIAKPFDEDAAVLDMEHSLASLSFTPGFAAPERSQGAGANTLSDIYSLGKLLSALTNETTDTELKAIIGKAAALKPESRYDTVNALMVDIDNYMGGFPVNAASKTSGYKFKKLIARQKLAVSLATVAAVGLIGGLIITSSLYRSAESARLDADNRFSETRELTSFLLVDFGEGLGKLPGTLPLQKKVSETSAKYLDILAKAAQDDPTLETDLAVGRMQLGDLLSASGGRNLGNPKEGLKQYEYAVETLSRLAKKPNPSTETLKLYADAVQIRAYISRFHFGDYAPLLEAVAITKPIYEKILLEDPDNVEAQAKLLDLRFELWLMETQSNPNPSMDKEILSIKEGIETLFANDLSNDDNIINYGAFLYITAPIIARKWIRPYKIITTPDRDEYSTLLNWTETGFNLKKQNYENEPANPMGMYIYFWALENYLPFESAGVEWRPSIFDLRDRLGQQFESEAALQNAIRQNPDFQKNLAIAEQMKVHLETSDKILTRLEPFDSKTFSYLQILFSTHRNRAYVHSGLSFEFSKAESNYMAAMAIVDQFLQLAPDYAQVRLEAISMRTQLALLLEHKDKILVGSNKDKICALLEESYQLAFSNNSFTASEIDFYYLDTIAPEQESHNCEA